MMVVGTLRRWRAHKTLSNGETMTQGRHLDIGLYPVITLLRMRELSHCLNKSDHCTLAVCTSSEKEAALANIKHAAAHLQAMAKVAHGVTSKKEPK